MKLLIKNGHVVDPQNGLSDIRHLLIADGRVEAVLEEIPQGNFRVIDAAGKIVCPGFIDIHMHGAHEADFHDLNESILGCMVRMGVTTGLGGNCGDNILPPKEYFAMVEGRLPINLALLAGHGTAREMSGQEDKYAPLSEEQLEKTKEVLRGMLDDGCFGVSYGIRYYPGMDARELLETARVCAEDHLMIAAHVRDDADYIFDSIEEFMGPGYALGLPVQISHIGSMGGYGQMAQVLSMMEEAQAKGLDVMADCYPYDAFSTRLGETTYDPGFLERYRCDYSAIALSSGEYAGQRCTKELFETLRREHPETITVGHVMVPEDIRLALQHPLVMLASDGLMEQHQGHPRAAGTFPRLVSEYVKKGVMSLETAVEKMTSMPAKRLGLAAKGNLSPGSDADIVIFDYDTIRDTATFENPAAVPEGIDYVLIGGEVACKDGVILNGCLGKTLKRK